ncbi:ABC transporter substrate-binding protein [Rhizobium pusense]|uniref:ABC transporter substrate-binding protein n=1 Tax=Agrobacterium pusense TaxID=648995 RepID=UPI002448070C|nr:ABC transporter substrate-binding protein [Agrobacterium pusense]MDH2091659.1 ABC transporter substrate-binding protein [Agrobacterium pusense]
MKFASNAVPRRAFMQMGAGAAAFAGFSRFSFAAGPTRVTTANGWVSNVQYSGFFLGIERGYFEEFGVKAEFMPGGPNTPDTLVSLSAGQAEIATANWLPFVDGIQKGNDFVLIGAQWAKSPAAVMSMAKKPLLKPEDILGMKILIQKPSDTQIIDAILDGAGLPHDYTTAPTGFSPEPLLAGDGDAYLAFATNQPITLEKMGLVAGKDFHVTLLDDLGYQVTQGLYLTSRKYLTENRAAVVGYMAGMIKGWKAAVAEPEAALDVVLNNYGADLGLDAAQQKRQNELQMPLVAPAPDTRLFALTPSVFTGPMTVVAKAAGRTVPDFATIADTTVVDEALAKIA